MNKAKVNASSDESQILVRTSIDKCRRRMETSINSKYDELLIVLRRVREPNGSLSLGSSAWKFRTLTSSPSGARRQLSSFLQSAGPRNEINCSALCHTISSSSCLQISDRAMSRRCEQSRWRWHDSPALRGSIPPRKRFSGRVDSIVAAHRSLTHDDFR